MDDFAQHGTSAYCSTVCNGRLDLGISYRETFQKVIDKVTTDAIMSIQRGKRDEVLCIHLGLARNVR